MTSVAWKAPLYRELLRLDRALDAYDRFCDFLLGVDPDPEPEPVYPDRCPELPALRRWRQEVKAGTRSPLTFDALWRAAAQESRAADWWPVSPRIASRDLEAARRTVAQASPSTRAA